MFRAEGKEREEDHDIQAVVVGGTIVGSSVTGKMRRSERQTRTQRCRSLNAWLKSL